MTAPRALVEQTLDLVMRRQLETVTTSETVAQASSFMRGPAVGSVVVVEENTVLGILTDQDLVRLVAQDRDLDQQTMAEAMTQPVITTTSSERVMKVVDMMAWYSVRHLPVLDAMGRYKGLITGLDLLYQLSIIVDHLHKAVAVKRGGRGGTRMVWPRPQDEVAFPGIVKAGDVAIKAPWLDQDATLREAAKKLRHSAADCLLMVDSAGLPSIFTPSDLIRAIAAGDGGDDDISPWVSSPVWTCEAELELPALARKMVSERVRHVVVRLESDEAGAVPDRILVNMLPQFIRVFGDQLTTSLR